MGRDALHPKTGFSQQLEGDNLETMMMFHNERFPLSDETVAEAVEKIKAKNSAYEVIVNKNEYGGDEGMYTCITAKRPLTENEKDQLESTELECREDAARNLRLTESRVIGEAVGLRMPPFGERLKAYVEVRREDFGGKTQKKGWFGR